jgi:hypothetical protein
VKTKTKSSLQNKILHNIQKNSPQAAWNVSIFQTTHIPNYRQHAIFCLFNICTYVFHDLLLCHIYLTWPNYIVDYKLLRIDIFANGLLSKDSSTKHSTIVAYLVRTKLIIFRPLWKNNTNPSYDAKMRNINKLLRIIQCETQENRYL